MHTYVLAHHDTHEYQIKQNTIMPVSSLLFVLLVITFDLPSLLLFLVLLIPTPLLLFLVVSSHQLVCFKEKILEASSNM
ncbi:unnamed protein product [Heterobilharzia americana]|nr:unnamed protein product [Heterobilharzia americana]